jgi:hypothetical protein
MHLQERIHLLADLGLYMASEDEGWKEVKQRAEQENGWFTQPFIALSINNIATAFLDEKKIAAWAKSYDLPEQNLSPKMLGLIMAGNIPMVGFHDFLGIFLCGHRQVIRTSSKDQALIRHILAYCLDKDERFGNYFSFGEMLKGCDAYIATGSNNSARYFDYYFAKYPHIIRRNRTSVAILTGKESKESLEKLADDVYSYFGLGCRNVTKIYVPEAYDFIPLLAAFRKYGDLAMHNKYKNNYDYQLTILILNKLYYMSNDTILLKEDSSPFSPISLLHYEYYKDLDTVLASLTGNNDIQCIAGDGFLPFGTTQKPGLSDYADGIDSMQFLKKLGIPESSLKA